jgi:superfamily I DNA/RNA helicase
MMELSFEQSAAVITDSDKALVLAGAGSGKTRVLTARIQHLVEACKVSPYEILSFTFTRKASQEMQKRLETAIGSKAFHVTMGTMHGVALNYLQRFGELVGLRPGKITVYSSWEEQFLLKDVAMELGYHTGKAWKGLKKRDVDRAFDLFYTVGFRDPETLEANELMDAFLVRCTENNALTYGTILTTFIELIPKITQFLDLRHILVDEVQDNDPLQWEIVNLLCKLCGASLFAVGDIDQSIYAFRGADPEYLVRNQGLFDIYRLQTNYRSGGNIVEAANNLIEHNRNRLEKTMVSKKDMCRKIETVDSMDSSRIAGLLAFYRHNVAVLARNHFMLIKLSRLLDEAHIKHEYIGKKTALTRSENFRRFHAFLKLIVNPFDNFSFLLIRDYIGVTTDEYKEIRIKAVTEYKSHFQAWCDLDTDDSGTWPDWFKASERGDISTVVDWMKDVEFGFDAGEIFDFLYVWILDNYDKTIDDYLNWLATFDLQDEIKDDPEKLQLMTIHAAKGLEWPTVIIAGLNEGIFPSKQSIKKNELEDERRLAYVAFTRAEDQLILTTRPFEKDKELFIKNPASRFIKESSGVKQLVEA